MTMRKMKFEDFEKSTLTKNQLLNSKGGEGSNYTPEIDENGNIINTPSDPAPPTGPGSLFNNGSGTINNPRP